MDFKMARSLSVLMWKHAVVRKRKFFLTAVDLVSPILFFALLFSFRSTLNPPQASRSGDKYGITLRTEPIQLSDNTPIGTEPPIMNVIILYHPETDLTNALMAEVGEILFLKRLNQIPARKSTGADGYIPYTNETEMIAFINEMQDGDSVIIFNNLNDASLPTSLNYTIRMKQNFHTRDYEPEDNIPSSHKMFGMQYLTFMRLQWAIDRTYIKMRSGLQVNQTVTLQEFPYYKTLHNNMLQLVRRVLEYITWLSLLLVFVDLMCRLLAERTSGIQELVKMVGVKSYTLMFSHYLNVLPSGLVFSIVGAIFLKISPAIIPHTNGFYLFLMLLLYFNTVIALAFVCSFAVRNTEYGATLAVISYGLLFMPMRFVQAYRMPYALRLLTGFLPHVPMVWFWNEICVLDMSGTGVTLSTLFSTNYKNNQSVFGCYVFLILQSVLYFGLAGYLSLVRPGKYGQALPWNFIFKKVFWTKQQPDQTDMKTDSDSVDLIPKDGHYFEEPPSGMTVGIFVDHVSKEYPNHKALKNVTLKVFEGEITVLVGHNGAGKTTLMSIITGMTSPTSGRVYVHGMDTMTQQHEVRKRIGLCPQHNMFFPDLTLQEHIMFFTMLKHGTFCEAVESSKRLAVQLGLQPKLGALCGELSGGMKRRAQLACALAGDADVLVLDEPTSGLDVESRRELWDLLLSLRGKRTVLLSTHFMEEADVLGDRVAALHLGELRCFATTMYLKKAVGDGYRLTLTTFGPPKVDAINDIVLKRVPEATLKEKTMNSISYSLPATASSSFPQLFATLEENRSKLNINSIGIGVSTLEEVFLKLCSDVEAPAEGDDLNRSMPVFNIDACAVTNESKIPVNGSCQIPEPPPYELEKYFNSLKGDTHKKLTGPHLYWRQLIVLLKRQISFIAYRKWIFLTMQVILPIALIFIVTSNLNNDPGDKKIRSLPMNLGIYADMPDKRVLYDLQLSDKDTAILRTTNEMYPTVQFEDTHDVAHTILRIGKESLLDYNKYLIGIEINDTDAKVLYTTTVRHAAPVALNVLSNMLAVRYLSWPTTQIYTHNYPFEGVVREPYVTALPKSLDLSVFWAVFITFFIQAAILHCVSLPCRERETGSRHIHIMSGCPSELYWIATLLFHLIVTFLFLILPTMVAAFTMERNSTIDQLDFIFVVMVILLVGSMAMFALMYLISFSFSERTTSIILVACLFIFGLVCPVTKAAYDLTDKSNRDIFYYVLEASTYVAPPYAMTVAMFRAVRIAMVNAICVIMKDKCPFINMINIDGWNDETAQKCCRGETPLCYFCAGEDTPLSDILLLLAQFVVLMTLVFMTQRGIFNCLRDWARNIAYRPQTNTDRSAMVRAESTYVEHEIAKNPTDIKKDSILVHDVHKNYTSWFSSCNAVKGVSFSVKKGECFGLLGVNGAGKSSTFKMLTTEECTTRGKIYGNGYHLKRGHTRYLQTLGYCPQFFGLDKFLTGSQNLTLLLTLRGLEQQTLKKEVKGWIEIVGLEKYAHRSVANYSGGCVRRLGAAAALCGGAPTTLLDEPSAGVDVAARRRLWTAIRRGLQQHRSIIITSHSMDEMEALCGRIAILCSGRVRALGSPADLRAGHAAGHAVVFKIRHTDHIDEVDGPDKKLNQLKAKLLGTFDCELKDAHKTMLHYHINETLRYSELFGALEELRSQFPTLIEDYAVTETTLEEVFLSLAKENKVHPSV